MRHTHPGTGSCLSGTRRYLRDSVEWGIRHRQEKTLVGLFQAPGPCVVAALRRLAQLAWQRALPRSVTREAAIGP